MNIFRKIATMIAFVALVGGFLSISAAPVNAVEENDSPDPCVGVDLYSGSGDCYDVVRDESTASAEASTKVTDVAVNGVDIHSKVKVLAFVKVKGMPKSQQTNCFRTKKPMKLWTSYINTSGQEVWHWKSYPAGKKFCKGKDGWYHDTVCYNKVKIKRPNTPPPGIKVYGKIKIVKKFVFSATALAEVNDKVTAKAQAWANTASCHAEASAKGVASFYAYARATVKGSVLVKVKALVKGVANDRLSVKLEGKSLVDIHANTKAKAGGEATATASAKAVCEDVPPPDNPPVIIDVTQVNDVDVTNTTQVCATVSVQNTSTLTFGARFGSFTTPKTFQVNGQVEKCATYQAPTEVPTGGTDTITYTVRDNTTGKTASDNTVFRINPSPEPPL